jgi:hypothetical protein
MRCSVIYRHCWSIVRPIVSPCPTAADAVPALLAIPCRLVHPPLDHVLTTVDDAELARLDAIVSEQATRTKAEMLTIIVEERAKRQQPTTYKLR